MPKQYRFPVNPFEATQRETRRIMAENDTRTQAFFAKSKADAEEFHAANVARAAEHGQRAEESTARLQAQSQSNLDRLRARAPVFDPDGMFSDLKRDREIEKAVRRKARDEKVAAREQSRVLFDEKAEADLDQRLFEQSAPRDAVTGMVLANKSPLYDEYLRDGKRMPGQYSAAMLPGMSRMSPSELVRTERDRVNAAGGRGGWTFDPETGTEKLNTWGPKDDFYAGRALGSEKMATDAIDAAAAKRAAQIKEEKKLALADVASEEKLKRAKATEANRKFDDALSDAERGITSGGEIEVGGRKYQSMMGGGPMFDAGPVTETMTPAEFVAPGQSPGGGMRDIEPIAQDGSNGVDFSPTPRATAVPGGRLPPEAMAAQGLQRGVQRFGERIGNAIRGMRPKQVARPRLMPLGR